MTAPTQLEEKVARAIHRTFPAADSDPWDDAVARYKAYGLPGNPPHVALALSAAAATLAVVREALAEASEEMQIAAASEPHYRHSDGLSYDDAEIAWRAMLAASPLRAGS
jgi:hypothetical protein